MGKNLKGKECGNLKNLRLPYLKKRRKKGVDETYRKEKTLVNQGFLDGYKEL